MDIMKMLENDVEMGEKDINMIEMLWAQDIDMGVSRGDSNPFKTELHFEKQKVLEEPEKPQDNWEYSIDGETGEYMPIQPQPPQQQMEVNMEDMQVSTEPNPDISFADCLQLLNDFEGLPETELTTAPQEPLITSQDIEQRWQDLADSIPELLSVTSQFQNTSWNQSLPSGSNQDVFAFNATTNGNVNLQNATDRSLPSFGNNSQQLNNSQFLTIDTHDSQMFLSSQALSNESDLFSPINRFSNMNLNASPQPPIPSTTELTNMLFPDEQQQQPFSEVDTNLPQEITADLNLEQQRSQNGSLLLDLLNSPADGQSELEEQEEELSNLLEDIGDEESGMDFMSDDNSSFADSDEVLEGATGLDHDLLKLGDSKDVYRRGGASPCESESGSTSSFEFQGSSQKFSENIQHNHTYASSSDSNNHHSSRSSNNSYNSSSEEEQEYRNRPSRDQRRAKSLNIPIAVEKIINLPVDSFNELIKKYDLNDAQMQLIRDIRRRGKNKVAAQNCRKRKISAISVVEKTVYGMQSEHDKLLKERDKIHSDVYIMQRKYEELYHQVFQNMRDLNGQRVDPDQYRLEVMDDGSVIIVPKNGSSNSTFHGN